MTMALRGILVEQAELETLELAVIDHPHGFRDKSLLPWIETHQALIVLEEEHPVLTLDDLGVHLVPVPHKLEQLKPVEWLRYLCIGGLVDGALVHRPPTVVLISQNTVIEVPELQVDGNFHFGIREDLESVEHLLQTSLHPFQTGVLKIEVIVLLVVSALKYPYLGYKHINHVVSGIIMQVPHLIVDVIRPVVHLVVKVVIIVVFFQVPSDDVLWVLPLSI